MNDLADAIANLTLFADLSAPQLEEVAHTFEEESFSDGQRILRQGFEGTGFYLILDGEAKITIDGEARDRLSRGDFFGELSLLLDEKPVADIEAVGPMRCLVLSKPEFEAFLMSHPQVMYRMLQAVARKLRRTSQWRT
jgi:CRP-like cAMP-binding protein